MGETAKQHARATRQTTIKMAPTHSPRVSDSSPSATSSKALHSGVAYAMTASCAISTGHARR
jgi:hypothetical protein